MSALQLQNLATLAAAAAAAQNSASPSTANPLSSNAASLGALASPGNATATQVGGSSAGGGPDACLRPSLSIVTIATVVVPRSPPHHHRHHYCRNILIVWIPVSVVDLLSGTFPWCVCMCVCPPSYQDRHHAVLLTRCLPASPPSPCRPTAMPSCDTHALSMVRAHVCAFSCLSVPVRFRPMCVSSVLFLVDFFVHASPHQLWRHCRNFLEQQTGFLSQRTAFVCVVSVFIAVGFKNLLNPAKVKYHHLQTPPSYLFFILTRAAPPPLLSSPCVPSRCPRLFLLPRF